MCVIKEDEEKLKIVERKIIRKIRVLVKVNDVEGRILMNRGIDKILKMEDIVRMRG